MHTTAGIGDGRRRRRPIRRIVFIVIVLAALIEPLVMYVTLTHERAERRAVADSSLSSSALASGN